jgi:hypothetical protein
VLIGYQQVKVAPACESVKNLVETLRAAVPVSAIDDGGAEARRYFASSHMT